jgi:hypothetical protein
LKNKKWYIYYMKNLQKGFAGLWIIMLIAILVIGGVYFYFHTSSVVGTGVTNQGQVPVATTTADPVSEKKPESLAVTPIQQKTKVPTSQNVVSPSVPASSKEITSCGSILNTNLSVPLGEKSKLTDQEKLSLACMSKAFSTCSQATVTLTSETSWTPGGVFKILPQVGVNCPVSAVSSTNPPLTMGCNLPMSLIKSWNEYYTARGQANEEFSVVPGIFVVLELSNTNILPLRDSQTGQQINLECFKK